MNVFFFKNKVGTICIFNDSMKNNEQNNHKEV